MASRPVVLLLAALLLPAAASAQTEVWLKVEAGELLYLAPGLPDWVPAQERERLPLQAFVLTGPETRALLFRATETYELPAGAYLFVEDVFPKTRMEIIDALTRIEAAQLPAAPRREREAARPLGLTYGAPARAAHAGGQVPFLHQRRAAVRHFYARERYDAALLMLKRSLHKFPDLYGDEDDLRLLLDLYARFGLHGFLLDECERLLEAPPTEAHAELLRRWRTVAREALARPLR